MARLGMDVGVVEGVGRQLKQQGQVVRSIVRTVDVQVNDASQNWWGNRAQVFASEWRGVHRPALTRLADAIEGLGQSALNNVAEQRSASGSGSGGRSWAPTLAGQGTSDLSQREARLSGSGILPAIGFMGLLGQLTGTYRGKEYPARYRQIFGESKFMRYNRTLQHLYSSQLTHLMESRPVKVVGKGADIFGVVTSGADFTEKMNASSRGGDKIEAGGGFVGSGIRAAAKDPVTYLVGVNVSLWSMVANEASKQNWSRDWSPKALSQLGTYMVSYPGEALGTIGGSVLEGTKRASKAL